jgi:hypothetical protein
MITGIPSVNFLSLPSETTYMIWLLPYIVIDFFSMVDTFTSDELANAVGHTCINNAAIANMVNAPAAGSWR